MLVLKHSSIEVLLGKNVETSRETENRITTGSKKQMLPEMSIGSLLGNTTVTMQETPDTVVKASVFPLIPRL